jgi:hypothetical protein
MISEARAQPNWKSRWIVWGSVASLILLAAAIGIEAGYPWVLKVPAQWLAVAAIPVLVALVKVGFIDEFTFGGVGIKRGIKDLGFFPQSDQEGRDRPPIKSVADAFRRQGRNIEIRSAAEVPDWPAGKELAQEYQRTHSLELVHISSPSQVPGQKCDISIYLMKHVPGRNNDNQTSGFTEIDHAEFFFGPSWGDRIFIAPNEGGTIGVNTAAWGQFLAMCRVIFNDGRDPVVLFRYIDFEMLRLR